MYGRVTLLTVPPLLHLVSATLIAGPSSDVPLGTSQVNPVTEVKQTQEGRLIWQKEICHFV